MLARLFVRWLGFSALAGFVPGLSSCGGSSGPPPASAVSPLLGQELPNFRRETLGGKEVEARALRGTVLVIELFAEHCVPCQTLLPAAEAAHQARPAAAFLGLSEDDDREGAARMVERHRVTFDVVHDSDRSLAGRLRLSELPATVVVDGDGVVRWVSTRGTTEDELTRAIDSVSPTAKN